MPLENDIQSFISWAISLGYPIEDMPNDDALKSIFKSRQSSLYFNIMQKVKPRQEISKIRQNILVNKMENLKDQVIPACKRSFLPREMQKYLKIQELRKEKDECDTKLNEAIENCNPDIIKIKNLQKIKMSNNCDTLKCKLDILDLKFDSLTEDCKKEIDISEKIESIMPVKLTSLNSNEKIAAKAVSDALKELDEFYRISMTNSNSQLINTAKDELWLKLKQIFFNIPNVIIWNIIMSLKEEQLQNIKSLNNKSLELNKKSSSDNITNFDVHMTKLKSSIIITIAKYVSVHKEYNNLNKKFTLAYKNFADAVQFDINFYNRDKCETTTTLSDDENDEIISDYIVQYTKLNYNKCQIDTLTDEIDSIKKYIDNNQHQLDDHQILMGTLKHCYNDIMITVQRIQQEILQLTDIKDKINYTKSLLQYMLNDIQTTRKQNKNKLSASVVGNSLGCAESFNISDNILCSTKLDFDCTTNSNMTIRGGCDNTVMSIQNFGGTAGASLPYNTELKIFMDISLSKLHIMNKECWPYLLPNPLVLESNDTTSTLQFCPGVLFTIDGSIKYINCKNNWYKKIKEISKQVQNDLSLIEVNQNYFKSKINQQREEVIEILDKIDILGINTNRTLQKAEKYYQFLLKNPLKNYIPKTKLFNNQTYFDYDSEYSMYYRMATIGVPIQE